MDIDVHLSLEQNLPAQFKLKMFLEYFHIRAIFFVPEEVNLVLSVPWNKCVNFSVAEGSVLC